MKVVTITIEEDWIETDYGFYTIKHGDLIFAYTDRDIFNDKYLVQVSDLTEFTTGEYDEVATLLHDAFGYELEGKFI